MGVFFWRYDLEPEFPLRLLEYETGSDDQMHSHDYLEVALCLEGTGRFLFGRRELPVEPGDLFLIDNLEAHVALPDPGVRMRLLLALFLPELIAAPGCRRVDSAYLTPFADEGDISRRIPHASALAEELRPILFELRTAAEGNRPSDRHLLDANLRRFLGVVMKHRGEGASRSDLGGGDGQHQLGRALVHIQEHFRETITLEQVAGIVHVSPSRARHLFKDATSVGFKEYLTKVRVAEAKRMLLELETNVCEIASAVGYTNIHQFYKVFHRYTGMSPADYRRYYTAPPGPGISFGRQRPNGAGDADDADDVEVADDAEFVSPAGTSSVRSRIEWSTAGADPAARVGGLHRSPSASPRSTVGAGAPSRGSHAPATRVGRGGDA